MSQTHQGVKALTLTLVLVPALVISCTGITDGGDVFVIMNKAEAQRILSGPVKRAFSVKRKVEKTLKATV